MQVLTCSAAVARAVCDPTPSCTPAPAAAIESAMEWAEQGGEMAAGKLAFELGELEDCMRGAASDAQ